MLTNKQAYKLWASSQEKKSREFYVNPLTNEISDFNLIAYKHKFYIGGTIDSMIMGLNPYATVEDAYNSYFEFKDQEERFVFDRGHALEPFVAQQFTKLTRIKVQSVVTAIQEVTGAEEGYDWAYAQIDRMLENGIPLEIKTATANPVDKYGEKMWGKGCDFNDSGVLITADDQIPPHYYIQVQKQMWLMKVPYMYLACWLTFENKIRVYKIERNDEVIEKIKEAEIDFLFEHVIPQIPYEKVEEKHLEDMNEEGAVYADSEFMEIFEEYKSVNQQANELKKQASDLSEKLKSLIGDASVVIDKSNNPLCKLSTIKVSRFDTVALKNTSPDLYKEFLVESEQKRLTIAKGKAKNE